MLHAVTVAFIAKERIISAFVLVVTCVYVLGSESLNSVNVKEMMNGSLMTWSRGQTCRTVDSPAWLQHDPPCDSVCLSVRTIIKPKRLK